MPRVIGCHCNTVFAKLFKFVPFLSHFTKNHIIWSICYGPYGIFTMAHRLCHVSNLTVSGFYSSLKMPIGIMMIEFNWYFRTVSVNDKVNDFIGL